MPPAKAQSSQSARPGSEVFWLHNALYAHPSRRDTGDGQFELDQVLAFTQTIAKLEMNTNRPSDRQLQTPRQLRAAGRRLDCDLGRLDRRPVQPRQPDARRWTRRMTRAASPAIHRPRWRPFPIPAASARGRAAQSELTSR